MRDSYEITTNSQNLQRQDSQENKYYLNSLSSDPSPKEGLHQNKFQNDFQRNKPQPKKKSIIQRIKQFLSKEIDWRELPERNIKFNASYDQNDIPLNIKDSYMSENEDDNRNFKNTVNNLKQPLIQHNESDQAQGNKLQSKKKKREKSEFCSNKICTSKYTFLNFIFLNLYEQFTKPANLYFLVMGIFQMIPAISISDGIPYVYIPLSIIVFVTAIKDIAEDIRRHQSDSKENNYPIYRYENGQFVLTQSQQIQVGDIVKIMQNNNISVDLALLYSSTQNIGNSNQARKKGVCYIETKNLDGETSFKSKNVSKSIQEQIDREDKIQDFEGLLKSESPNPYLYKYNGSLVLFRKDKQNKDFRRIHIEEDNFVLRGCVLRNTDYIIGVSVFTGHETKIMLNSIRPRIKKSKVELDMNKQIILIWLTQMIFCIISSVFGLFWWLENKNNLPYLFFGNETIFRNDVVFIIIRYANWLIILMNFLPISLLITLDMIRLFQAVIIMKSKKMISYHKLEYYNDGNLTEQNNQDQKNKIQGKKLDGKQNIQIEEEKQQEQETNQNTSDYSQMEEKFAKIQPIVQSSNLNEDLGQIKCVFSDKTGTLTCNVMNLKAVIFNGKIYGNINDENQENINLEDQEGEFKQSNKDAQSKSLTKKATFQDQEFISRVNNGNEQQLQEFIEHLAICHTVIYSEIPTTQIKRNSKDTIEQNETRSQKIQDLNEEKLTKSSENAIGTYQSASPDELALVNFAKMCGIEFKGHDESENISIVQKYSANQLNKILQNNGQDQSELNNNNLETKKEFQQKPNLGETNKMFKLLKILHFTSERKRMSVIIQNSQGQIILLIKGADQVIIPKLNGKQQKQKNIEVDDLLKNLQILSKKGLRTLVMAQRILDKDYYNQWEYRFEQAQNIVGDQKEVQVNNLMDDIEQNLTLLGATGIEDKLQNEVQDTIVSLKNAGITVWILTGDKRETAINIAISSMVVEEEKVIEIYETDIELLEQQLTEIKQSNVSIELKIKNFDQNGEIAASSVNREEIYESSFGSDDDYDNKIEQVSSISSQNMFNSQSQSDFKQKILPSSQKLDNQGMKDDQINSKKNECQKLDQIKSNKTYSLAIEGSSLDLILKADENVQKLFLEILKQAVSVVACRVSPKQKQQIVILYKQFFPKHRTLAIGDGANDVNMLTEAHVGIGIQGLEGLQAARASDYAIGEFKLLKRLLFVHGRECYRKNSTVILYNFYKNIVYLVPLFWYGIYSGFSGAFIYDFLLFQCFNIFFTSLPIIIFAILDKDISHKILLSVPYFYKMGIQNRYFNTGILWQWFFNGIFQSFVISMFSIFIMTSLTPEGRECGIYILGQVIYGISIVIVNSKYLINIIVCFLSFLVYVIGAIFFNYMRRNLLYLELSKLVIEQQTYYSIALILTLTSLLDYGVTTYFKAYQKSLKQVKSQPENKLNPQDIENKNHQKEKY